MKFSGLFFYYHSHFFPPQQLRFLLFPCSYPLLWYAERMLSAITPHILESLRNPSAYPVQTRTVELIQTHISWLFLTETHVFKLKKPVNFGFLDFSTHDLRRFYCHEELRLNRRLCPDIYERVIALREADDGATFVGNGAEIDSAVMMKRLPADRMLDRLVDSDMVSAGDIELVAREISRFHASAPTSPAISAFGSLQQIRFNWQENFAQTVPFLNSTLPPSVRENIRRYVELFIDTQGPLFEKRIENGLIRDCDGDIHLGNICLNDSKAYIFDCIEFNERFRYSDTAADIAFLLMDLDYHHRPDLADAALAAYVAASGDRDLAELVVFYKVYRAFVRGKVESLRLLDAGIVEDERAEAEKRARRYFRLAQGYALRYRLPPTLFITCGTMGCGKSTLSTLLAFELGIATFNSDAVRKQLAGITPETTAEVSFAAGIYADEMSRRTYRRLEQLADSELASGHSVIIDAACGSAAARAGFARIADSRRTRFVILHVQCTHDIQLQRLRDRSARRDSVSDGRVELLDEQERIFSIPDDGEGTVISVNSDGAVERSLDRVYEKVLPS